MSPVVSLGRFVVAAVLVSLGALGCARSTPAPAAVAASAPSARAHEASAGSVAQGAVASDDASPSCCCAPPAGVDARWELTTPGACAAAGGRCLLDEQGLPDESECHGIEGPIPD